MKDRIWLSLAHMGGEELNYIREAFETNWVVPLGPNVDAFENALSNYIGGNIYTIALSSGTAAIHLALVLLGIQPGDEVICQSFTFAASANPIKYLCAIPIFVDSELETWNMDPELLEKAILDRINKVGKKPKAIIPVHLYGMPANMEKIMIIAEKYNIPVIEDAAEGLGSTYKGEFCGTFGEYGILSFNGNKIITTSGGGALICKTEDDVKKTKFLATQARDEAPYYQHSTVGYNYRMSNICAGIGRGQMLVLREHVERRREIHQIYSKFLNEEKGLTIQQEPSGIYSSNFWLTTLLIDPVVTGFTNNELRLYLEGKNIETRLLWKPLHLQPVFANSPFYGNGNSEMLFNNGLCLPSGSSLSNEDIKYVIDEIKNFRL